MNRSAQVRAARVAGGVLMLAAVIPALTAGAALAADAPAAPVVAESAPSTAYADEVGIGTALKIAAPGVAKAVAPKAAPSSEATPSDAEVIETDSRQNADDEATPPGAEVIETDSRQNSDPTEVAVLGTKIGSNQLADTGPSQVTTQALLAVALIVLGIALRSGPALVTAAGRRRH